MKHCFGKIVGALAGALMFVSGVSAAFAEERTLALYMVHTKETLVVTYKKNGRYIPSAMKKINWLLRDWRRDVAIKMDPKTIDLMWELHADLGSQKPIHIISGYRSGKTNAMLKRIGRKVARRSQHIKGKAVDMYFPDVSTHKVRNSALVREIGGVGYYPRSGKYGFIHIDSGKVRHWPRLSEKKLAQIKRSNRKTVGARKKRPGYGTAAGQSWLASLFNRKKPDTSQQVAGAETGQNGPISLTPTTLIPDLRTSAVPTPRPKPYEVYVQAALAAQDLRVAPASVQVERTVNSNYNLDQQREKDQLGLLATAVSLEKGDYLDAVEDQEYFQRTNSTGKGSFVANWADDTIIEAQPIQPTQASISATPAGWSNGWLDSLTKLFRTISLSDKEPKSGKEDALLSEHTLVDMTAEESAALDEIVSSIVSSPQQASTISGKGDMLTVNRTGKGNLVQ